MNGYFSKVGLSTRLVLGLVILILTTTLSAGVPAYLITRAQLEAQAWQQVDATYRTTQSLYLAEESNSADLTTLLSERPTLRRLVEDDDLTGLNPYLQTYQGQSDFDFIQICDLEGELAMLGGKTALCPTAPGSGFELVDGRPALIAAQSILSNNFTETIGSVVTGKWLDDEYLQRLSVNTGVDQSILSADGIRLASTLPSVAAIYSPQPNGQDSNARLLTIEDQPYFSTELGLETRRETQDLRAEIGLPVQDLVQTERNALLILITSTGLVALVGVVLGIAFIRRLTRPLSDITQAAERISRGDLTAPIPQFSGPPELITLSTSLERSQATMLEALDERSQARDWLDSLIQSVVEGVITIDTVGQITFMSQGAQTLLGWPSTEAVGRSVNAILPLAEPRGETFLDRIPPKGEKREIEVLTRSGKSIVLATTGSQMVPPNSTTVQVALVLRDVTEEQALRNLRSFFLANISHEFRTPLSTLNASMELLMEEADKLSPAEIRELMKPTYLSLVSLQSLIDNLLESSRIEAGHFTLRMQPVNLSEVINNSLSIIGPLMDRRQQTITVTEPARMPPLVADQGRLTQALVNLITNAVKYSSIGQPIELGVEQFGGMVRMAVADRGPGITPEDRVNLFRRFMRLHADSNEQYGIGLGLYLVKRIAEAHGGQVGVDDRSGGGAIFWMEIPVAAEKHE
jgi:PAS domain S-box-containing protein